MLFGEFGLFSLQMLQILSIAEWFVVMRLLDPFAQGFDALTKIFLLLILLLVFLNRPA